MGFSSTSLSNAQVDNVTTKLNASNQIEVDTDGIGLDDNSQIDAVQQVEIIELQADATASPPDYDNVVAETFSDSGGYNNLVNTGNTSATFDTNKYKRANAGTTESAHFDMNDASGNATDKSGNGYDATQNGTISSQTGKISNCRGAYSDSNYFAFTDIDWDRSKSLSVSCWVYCTNASPTRNNTFLRQHNVGGNQDYFWLYYDQTNAKFKFECRTAGVGGDDAESSVTLEADTWYHLIGTFDKSDGSINLYVNNVAGTGGTYAATTYANTNEFRIGRDAGSNQYSEHFYIDDVRFYDDVVITSAERDAIYNSGSGTEDSLSSLTSQSAKVVEVDLPATITGTVTHTMVVVNDPERETGDSVTYDIVDSASAEDTAQALDTKNALTTPDGTKIVSGKLKINLTPKDTSPTDGYPSVKSIALLLWKS